MARPFFSEIQDQILKRKTEFFIIIFALTPAVLFITFAVLENDFLVLDHSYWVGVIAYNLTLVFGIWIAASKKVLQLSEGLLWVGLGITIVLYFVFHNIIFTGDITQGVIKGSSMLWEGKNPYVVAEVPHAKPYPPGGFRYVTYAYLPVDLLFYSLVLGTMNIISSIFVGANVPSYLPGFTEMGIFITNLILMLISIILIRDILEIKWKQATLLGGLIFLILIWNNVCLAQTLFIAGWYFHKRKQTNITVVFWSLSMLSKYFAGIFIVSYVVEYLMKKEYVDALIKTVIAVALSLLVSIPFGIVDVLKSTVFFYNTEERILDGSFGGSIFSELVLFFNLENIIWLFTILGFFIILIIAFLIKDLYQRLVITSCLALCVITGISAQFLPTITFILIIAGQIIIFKNQRIMFDAERNIQVTTAES
jgi:hypothetical protein